MTYRQIYREYRSEPPRKGGYSSAAGPLGIVGSLDEDGEVELEISPHLWEEGQGGQGGQAKATVEGWPPSDNGVGHLERPQAHHQPDERVDEPPGPIMPLTDHRARDDVSEDYGSGGAGREEGLEGHSHGPDGCCIHDVLGGCWLCRRKTSEKGDKGSPKRLEPPF